jgi:hypothetical protein
MKTLFGIILLVISFQAYSQDLIFKNGFESGVVEEQVIDDNNNIYWGDIDWQLMVDGTIEVTINELEEEGEEEEEKSIDYVDLETQEYNNTLKENNLLV